MGGVTSSKHLSHNTSNENVYLTTDVGTALNSKQLSTAYLDNIINSSKIRSK